MTKVRFKVLLAVVVALSLFVCSSVVGFAIDFSFPSFSYYRVSYRNSSGSFNEFLSDNLSSGTPFTFVSNSVPQSFDRLYFFLSGSDYSPYKWSGFKAGYYTGSLVISSSSPVPNIDFFEVSAPANNKAYIFDSTFKVFPNVGNVGFIVSFEFFVPSNFADSSSELIFKFGFSSLVSGSFSFYPSVLPDTSYYNLGFFINSYSDFYEDHLDGLGTVNVYDLSRMANFIDHSLVKNLDVLGGLISDQTVFLSRSLSSLNNISSYLFSQSSLEDDNYKASVPSGLGQQQQEAQNQLTDYENKEQAVFDNLNTSLDDLNLDQYTTFSPSILSSMSFINGYVTGGFDGLGDFKIILFLPMVLGIGLSVIGRMGHMLSNRPTRGRGDGP